MYFVGEGVPENAVTAYAWFNLAAAQGNEDARELRDKTKGILMNVDVTQYFEGQRLSQELAARIERRKVSTAQD